MTQKTEQGTGKAKIQGPFITHVTSQKHATSFNYEANLRIVIFIKEVKVKQKR